MKSSVTVLSFTSKNALAMSFAH